MSWSPTGALENIGEEELELVDRLWNLTDYVAPATPQDEIDLGFTVCPIILKKFLLTMIIKF